MPYLKNLIRIVNFEDWSVLQKKKIGNFPIVNHIEPDRIQHFYKPAEYEKWGDKWYKKS